MISISKFRKLKWSFSLKRILSYIHFPTFEINPQFLFSPINVHFRHVRIPQFFQIFLGLFALSKNKSIRFHIHFTHNWLLRLRKWTEGDLNKREIEFHTEQKIGLKLQTFLGRRMGFYRKLCSKRKTCLKICWGLLGQK